MGKIGNEQPLVRPGLLLSPQQQPCTYRVVRLWDESGMQWFGNASGSVRRSGRALGSDVGERRSGFAHSVFVEVRGQLRIVVESLPSWFTLDVILAYIA